MRPISASLASMFMLLSFQGDIVDRLRAIQALVLRRQFVLQAARAVIQHAGLVGTDSPRGDLLLVRGIARGPLRTHQKSLAAGDLVSGGENRRIIHRDRETVALADGP